MEDLAILFIFILAFCFMNQLIKTFRHENKEKADSAANLASICFALMMLFVAMLINS